MGMPRGCPLSPGASCPSPSRPPPRAAEQRHSRSCLCRAPFARTRPLSPCAGEELRGRLRLTERAALA
eukprot:2328717-Pyramimonas_sp.AAC.1